MIDIKEQEELFILLGNTLKKRIYTYAIGGTAMMLKSIKDATLDIDLVFDKKEEREDIIIALKEIGAKDFDTAIVYGEKENIPVMLAIKRGHIDLFMNKIITSIFSEKMKERAEQIHEFGKNLIIKVADPHDVIIMKSVTSRAKDIEDIVRIAKKINVDWNIIIQEAKNQVKLGNEKAILSLGEKLEKLNNAKAIIIPKDVLGKLWTLLKKQIDKKAKKKSKYNNP